MKIEIAACERPPPELRERYFAALPEPQVHYLEQRVAAARLLRLGPADAPLGYMAIHDGAVVEFHAEPALLPQLSEAFYAAAALGGAGSAIVKSYDALALAAATGRPALARTVGVNCTAWTDARFEPPLGFIPRLAAAGDRDFLAELAPGLFEHPDE